MLIDFVDATNDANHYTKRLPTTKLVRTTCGNWHCAVHGSFRWTTCVRGEQREEPVQCGRDARLRTKIPARPDNLSSRLRTLHILHKMSGSQQTLAVKHSNFFVRDANGLMASRDIWGPLEKLVCAPTYPHFSPLCSFVIQLHKKCKLSYG